MSKMKKNRKKLFAILLQAALVSTAMTMPAYAAKTPGIGSDALMGTAHHRQDTQKEYQNAHTANPVGKASPEQAGV